MRLIKKYANRRLYDIQTSKYINLDDIRQMILRYEPFKVIDADNIDLTNQVLLQIILSQESSAKSPLFTSQILQELIRLNENQSLQPFISNYIERSISHFIAQQENLNKYMENMASMDPFGMMKQFFQSTTPQPVQPLNTDNSDTLNENLVEK